MDVLLVKPQSNVSNVMPPIGLGYLSSSLKKGGISAKIIDCMKEEMDALDVANFMKKENIRIVGVTCCSNEHWWLSEFAKTVEDDGEITLIAGGPHATGLGKRLFELIPRLDFIIRAEGEISFPKLVRSIMNKETDEAVLSNIPNLVWRNSRQEAIENPSELPGDLDMLDMPDWEQMKPSEYAEFSPHGGFAKTPPVGQLFTTRGCPYGCRFCAASVMNGKKIRRRSAESIVGEIKYLVKNYGVREVHIEDDNFSFYKNHVVDICKAVRKNNIKLNFGLPNGIRVDRLDKEILEELQSTGFYFFSVGIESGSPATLKRMNKALDLEKIKQGISLVRRYRFRIKGFFMLGYPGETEKEIMETIQFAKSLNLDQAFFSIYVPLPGTLEFQKLEKDGIIDIKKCNWRDFYTGKFSSPPYVPEGMSTDRLTGLVSLAYRSFYFRPKIMCRILKDITNMAQTKHLLRRGLSLITPKRRPKKIETS